MGKDALDKVLEYANDKELINDIFLSTLNYLKKAISEVEILSNEFYKIPTQDSWKKIIDLIEGIKWIMDSFAIIDMNDKFKDIVKDYKIWNLYTKDIYSLKKLMKEFEEILGNKDFISIADILSYEIIPLFNKMKEKLDILLDGEVNLSDFS